jgi:iron complex transport system substrate-binding protein
VALTVLLALGTGRGWAAERVVSLNLCTDQLLVLLAPEKIAALSSLARDPSLSFVAKQAAQLPLVRPYAEAVLRLRPDLVLAAPYGAQTTLALLEARGLPVFRIGLATSFADIRAQIRSVAAALGEAERGEALIAEMDRRLADLPGEDPSRRGPPRKALAWEARGYTAGPGTLADAVLRAAGLENASDGRRIGLEALLAHPPDLLVVAPPAAYPSLATDLLRHPATAAIPRRFVPPALTICAGPFTVEAAELLAR